MGIAGNPSRPTAGRRPRRWPANWPDSCAEPLLIDVGEAEVHAVVLFEDVIETGRDIGDGLRNRIYGVEVGIDQRDCRQFVEGVSRHTMFGQRADSNNPVW